MGLLVGALIGRTIPGAILAGALCISLIIGTSLARDAWLASLPATIIATPGESGEVDIPASAIFTGDAWEAPDGAILTTEEARRIATDGGVPPAESGDEQDARAAVWLSEHGYTPVVMGITDDRASAWAGYDLLIFGAAGLLSAGASFAVVRRRRPD
ncbi:MAG TPA: hypothetical protein VFW95_10875 [Candidatus Limnocylindria bacterium]|nr:hypothetical protein [Candidatus Limnocylindria bacterium]